MDGGQVGVERTGVEVGSRQLAEAGGLGKVGSGLKNDDVCRSSVRSAGAGWLEQKREDVYVMN